MLNVLFYLPLMMFQLFRAWFLPRALFVATYSPSSDQERERENYIRNKARLAEYKIKRALHND